METTRHNQHRTKQRRLPAGPLPSVFYYLLYVAFMIPVAALGCSEPNHGETVNPVDGGSDVTDDTEVDSHTPDAVTVIPPGAPLAPNEFGPDTWCTPEAVAYGSETRTLGTPVNSVPRLPEEAQSWTCGSSELDQPADNGESTVVWTFDRANNLIVHNQLSSPENQSTTEFYLDQEDRIARIVSEGVQGFYVAESGRTEYDFNESGQLFHKVATRTALGQEEPMSIKVKSQLWEGDRLLERVEVDGINEEVIREFRWTYTEDGKLLTAELEEASGRVLSAAWEWNANGLPTQVIRTVDGIEIERESWVWDEFRLESRTWEGTPRNVLEEWHELQPGTLSWNAQLDSWENPSLQPGFVNADFPTSIPTQTAAGCWTVPRGPGHGFPAAERVYNLAVERGDRPAGIGFAYGYDGFGWNYGDDAWFGHFGVGSWLFENVVLMDRTIVGVQYDEAGRMVGESVLAGQVGPAATRTRTWDEGRLTEDRLEIDAGHEGRSTRLLTFDYDENGLIERTLSDDEGALAWQTWKRNDLGLPTEHVIEFSERHPVLPGNEGPARLTWEWDDAGRVAARTTTFNERSQEITRDAEGRPVEIVGAWSNQDWYGKQTLSWDADGRLVEDCKFDPEGNMADCTETLFGEAGRIEETIRRYPNGEQRTLYSYFCLDQ